MGQHSCIVVTGAAAYTCWGVGCEVFWSRLRAGFGGNSEASAQASRCFGPLDLSAYPKIRTNYALAARLLAAIEEDLGEFLSGLATDERENVGVALGSAYGHLNAYFNYYQIGTEQGYQLVNPRQFPETAPNFCTAEINNTYSLWGSSTAIGSGLGAGLEAIGYAATAIARGDERMMLAGGADELNEYNQKALERVGCRSPSGSVRPFASDRDGTVPGEAAAVLLLQSLEGAQAAGRKPLAEVCGCTSVRGVHWDAPEARARAAKAIQGALELAGVPAAEIDTIFPSANGSVPGDEFEQVLLRDVFGERLASILICPVKGITGECFAASGPLQCLAAVYAVSQAPEGPGSAVRLAGNGSGLLLGQQIGRRSKALVYSIGYDGTLTALVVRRPTK